MAALVDVSNTTVGKLDALQALRQHISFDREVFVTLHELKEGRQRPGDVPVEALFERYLRAVEAVTDVVGEFQKGADR